MTDVFAQLHEILANRVMVLDGAMGTEIQTYKLESKDYIGIYQLQTTNIDFQSGEEFKNHSKDVTGNNDILSLTRPDLIKKIHLVRFYRYLGLR